MANLKLNFKYLKHLAHQHRRVLYLLFVVFAFAYPLPMFIGQPNWTTLSLVNLQPGDEIYFPIFSIPLISLVVLFIAAFIVIFIVFSYTNNKANMDNYLSFPISKENLYFNQLVFSFLMVIIPFAFMWIAGWGVGKLLYQPHYTWMLQHVGENYTFFEMMGQLLMIGLFIPVFLGVTMFALVNTPTLVDGALYGISLHLLPYFIFFSLSLLADRYVWGFNYSSMEDSIIAKLRFDSVFFENVQPSRLITFNFDWTYVVWIVLGFALIFINMKLFKKRPVEAIGTNKVNNWFYPIIANLATFLLLVVLIESMVLSAYNADINDYLYPLVAGFIFYFILDMIRNRGLSNILKMTLLYIGLFALAISTFLLMDIKGGELLSQTETRTELKSVELRSYTPFKFMTYTEVNVNSYGDYYYGKYFFTEDEEIIELAKSVQLHTKELYFEYFGNRLGSQNDNGSFMNIIHDDSAYQYYRQQNPSELKVPISQYFDSNSEYYPRSEEFFHFQFIFTDEQGNSKRYDYYLPIEWIDELIIELTPGL